MKVGLARSAAVQWVARHAQSDADFRGAYFSGSTVGLPDDAELLPSSDVDILVVTAHDDPPTKPGKLRYQDVLLGGVGGDGATRADDASPPSAHRTHH